MGRGSFVVRAALAVIFSPIVAGFAAAFVFTGLVLFAPTGGGLAHESVASLFSIAFFYGLIASFFGAPLTLVATLPTQPSLLLWYRKRGRAPLWAHLAISAALGIVLLWLLLPVLTPLGRPRFSSGEDLLSVGAVGAVGGAAVGLLWHRLVIAPLVPGGSPDAGRVGL